jgi:hypothetical protein
MVASEVGSVQVSSRTAVVLMSRIGRVGGCFMLWLVLAIAGLSEPVAAGEPAKVVRNVVVYGEPGRFAGWPANHGIWSWGDEILVGFSRGYVYGRRAKPFGIYARLSSDQGKTWSNTLTLRDDGGGRDIGYVRSIVRPDGKVIAVYYYHDTQNSERYLAATTWDPGRP